VDIIEEALWWAEAGVPVFPTGDDKRPLTRNGHKNASTDPDLVRELFEQAGNRAHGIGGRMGRDSGLFAIDADLYKPGEAGASAAAFVDSLRVRKLLPETRTHKTRNGGVHYIFKSATDWPNVNPASGVEVKGEGGYIILPPTPGYSVEREGATEAPPALIAELLAARSAQSGRTIDVLKAAVLRGDDFHDPLTQMAAKLSADGRPVEHVQAEIMNTLAASVAMAPTHPRHDRWRALIENTSGELSRIVESANRKFNWAAASDALREAAGGLFSESAPPPRIDEPTPVSVPSVRDYAAGGFPFDGCRGYFAQDPLNVLEQRFVMYPILSEKEVTLISADPKAGKTLVSQTIAMHIATGLDLAALKVADQRPVIYFALESQVAIRKRMEAWLLHHDPDGDLGLKEKMQMYVYEGGLNLLDETVRQDLANRLAATELWFKEQHDTDDLGAIVIDTLTKAMPGGDQNSVEDTSAVFDIIEKIRATGLTAPVIIIHHNTKGSASPRGSGNIQAEPDTLLTVAKNTDTGQLHMRVLMARSIDDTQSFVFDISTVGLGTTAQGYEVTAPVLTPAIEAAASDDLAQSFKMLPLYERVKDAAKNGAVNNKALHALLKEAPELSVDYDKWRDRRADTAALSRYWMTLFPPTGVVLDLSDGAYHFAPMTHMNRLNEQLVGAVMVRRFENQGGGTSNRSG
jgi:hypothetical protein